MKDNRAECSSKESTTEQEREAYYRACIIEFQQLGYQDQYLADLTDELVPVLGVDSDSK